MKRLGLGMCVVLLGLCPSTLAAQPAGPLPGQSRVFGGVAIIAGGGTDGTRDMPALGLGFGARLSPVLGVRFEVKIPKRQVNVTGQPTSSLYVRETTRVASYSILLARQLGRDRSPHVELLGGLSDMLFSSKGNSVLRLRSADGSIRLIEDEFDDTEHSMALTIGLDGVLPLTRRIDLVPQVRADWAGLGALFRGGISVRAHF